MKTIGGYFELELSIRGHFHQNAVKLNTARNCFEYILLARNYSKVYMPYYTCEVLLQPLHKYGISYEFYHIDENLEPIATPHLKDSEAFLCTNYYGLKQKCVERLADVYGSQLIVDNAQAFYASRIEGIDTFYSPRKYMGVPDGGYLYTDCLLNKNFVQDKSYGRMQHLLQRIDEGAEAAYSLFKSNSALLSNVPIRRMSALTERLLQGVNYEQIKSQRMANFLYLHDALAASNRLSIDISDVFVPMIYPFYTEDTALRLWLIKNKVFVATYWPNVLQWCLPSDTEYTLCNHILPLPIDQRYNRTDMKRIIQLMKLWKL